MPPVAHMKRNAKNINSNTFCIMKEFLVAESKHLERALQKLFASNLYWQVVRRRAEVASTADVLEIQDIGPTTGRARFP